MDKIKVIIGIVFILLILISLIYIKSSQKEIIVNENDRYSLKYSPGVFSKSYVDSSGLLTFSKNSSPHDVYLNVLYLNNTGINRKYKTSSLVEDERRIISELEKEIVKSEERKIGDLSGTILYSQNYYVFIGTNERDETIMFEMTFSKNISNKEKYMKEFYSIVQSYKSI